MALQRIGQAAWDNNRGYVDIEYDDATLATGSVDVTRIFYANASARARYIEVYDTQRNRVIFSDTLTPGLPEQAVSLRAGQAALVADAEGSLSMDRWSLRTRSV